jgi:Tetratricopeptide repeat
VAASLRALGWARCVAGDFDSAQRHSAAGLAHARRIGDGQGEAWSLADLGALAIRVGQLERARARLQESLAIFAGNEASFGMYRCHLRLAEVHRLRPEWSDCLDHSVSALHLQGAEHFTTEGGDLLDVVALTARSLGDPAAAARLSRAAVTWRLSHGETDRVEPGHRDQLGELRRELGEGQWSVEFGRGDQLTSSSAAELLLRVIAELRSQLPAHRPG